MNAQGIKYLSYFQVDNPLINLADPYFIGYHISKKSKVTTKVIKKLYPEEKLGCIVNSLEKNSIIEYSDLPKEKMYEKDSAGELKYLFGSIGIHIFNVDFLLKATSKLPIHFAKKQIEGYIFKENDIAEKGQMNAIKFETFVFDVIAFANKSFFFETDREDEFAPLKNKTGVDSIETCIKGQISQYKNWLKKSGLLITDLTDQKLEISPLFTPDEIIFLEKAKKQPEYIKQKIYDENGNLRENIFID
ncbi:MAG: hypothetical protein A2Z98_10875 [Spirochaetes bacterium GWB1_27_13]|nr:MAG: hypothetical protein A2Z98_10875 [Spirochaetes bacterium GWB1_27_13]